MTYKLYKDGVEIQTNHCMLEGRDKEEHGYAQG